MTEQEEFGSWLLLAVYMLCVVGTVAVIAWVTP